ncbi:Chitinase [Purpureocillium takamizusanense]|uniref:chitinase n=1 Tax=Purpureocillium takamizusanense TaxID=2060973 RepID=A0A9Q8VBD7_9HYPO|nr:Chitinase [Purpureocillium takamizusanense]UNI18707.1 Chitinase [Purpureocillium takamizusanense]
MVSTAANRAAFISSLAAFMETYGFQGADIDWEYPSEPARGGRAGDAANFVLLVKELRAAFKPEVGISVALAPDYWYLRGFRPKEMEPYVDFFGFMSYDLHGPWDSYVGALGSIVRPQTDITDVKKDLLPLVYDGVDFGKINLGLAYYGRTYTLSDPECGDVGCQFVSGKGGASGRCTNSSGILSLMEIRRLIASEGAKPYLNSTAMVKYFTYGGGSNWVGYDDHETLEMKRAFAEESCLGGTMIWSVDFDTETESKRKCAT